MSPQTRETAEIEPILVVSNPTTFLGVGVGVRLIIQTYCGSYNLALLVIFIK